MAIPLKFERFHKNVPPTFSKLNTGNNVSLGKNKKTLEVTSIQLDNNGQPLEGESQNRHLQAVSKFFAKAHQWRQIDGKLMLIITT